MKTHRVLPLLALLALPIATASAQLIGYTNGSQVNLLNAYNASLSISGTDAGSDMPATDARFYVESSAAPNAVAYYASSSPAATLDFGAIRNVKTITTQDNFGAYDFTAALVETSNDGTTWTSQGNVVTSPDANQDTLVTLNTAVNARYVRLTPTTFENGSSGRWIFNTMRAFGSTGALAGDTNLTIVANGGLSAAQSLTAIGSISQINPGQMIAPATSVMGRQLLYNIGDGEGFKLDLGQAFTVDRGTINLSDVSASGANPLVMTLSGSTDGTTFTTLYTKTYTSNVSTFDLFNYSFAAASARYLDVTFSTAIDTDLHLSDFAFFQTTPVPEPSTYALLGVAFGTFALRRRSRSRRMQG